MTSIAILGAGRVAANLAAGLTEARHRIIVGTRRAVDNWAGPQVAFADMSQAARTGEIVINATPGEGAAERLAALREALDGKVLIDVANATGRDDEGRPNGLYYRDGSLGERIQQALPRTRVVKTLNTMLFPVMTAPGSLTTPPTAFLSGNDADAKAVVRDLLTDLGWAAEWIEDLGDITTARGTESLMLLVPSIIRNHGMRPFALAIAAGGK
ncbi:NAD(P)-binding domain-containing protein [Nocardia sp. NPDC046763]|uniref:NADPH-dependent F420 reductase n=1 Tax=Nocardia sp. NPDC046763 TaxID=3155256 RepID=UPI0033DBE2AC